LARLHQHILDNLTTAVVLLGEDLRLRYMNPAAEELFDISVGRMLGRPVEDLFWNAELTPETLRQALRSGHPFTDRELGLELPGRRQVTVGCTVTPLLTPGAPVELLVEMERVDRHLRIAREETLIAQQQAARLLVRGLAHEVKNPLGGLRGAAQLLERELHDPALKEYTGIIIGEADRLQELVDRLLGPHSLPRKRSINIHEVLERVRTLVLAEAPESLSVVRDYDPSIPELNADPDQLIQALLNIVRNAVQALEGRGRITLRTRTVRRFTIGHKCYRVVLRVDIIDNGPGIPKELLENIFYPMVTGRPDGTGLGLSIAQFLISQHAGLVECDSRPGRTVFRLHLPLENAGAGAGADAGE
jgi:two-component system nitrogen regulation sensor histidine kinase GlnL